MSGRSAERTSSAPRARKPDPGLREALESARQERDEALSFLDVVAQIIVALDRDGRITTLNKAGCKLLGYDEMALIGKDWFATCLPARVCDEVRARFQRVMNGEKPISERYDNNVITRGGKERRISWHNTLLHSGDGRIVGTLSSGEDITERRRTEEVVSAIAQGTSAAVGKAFFNLLVQCLADTLGMDYAYVGELVDGNPQRVFTLARYAKGEFLNNVEYDLTDTPCENVVAKRICTYPSGVQARFPRDRILAEMGVESYVGTPLFGSTDQVLGLIAVMGQAPIADPNFTESVLQIFAVRAVAEIERAHAETALRESRERLKLALQACRMGTWDWDIVANRFVHSEETGPLFGRSPDTPFANFEEFTAAVHPGDRDHMVQTIHRALKESTDYGVEYRVTWPDGSVRWIADHGKIYRDETGKPIRLVGVSMDIAARKQAEEQARQHQTELAHAMRVSSMGEMASGLAHELNQPLTAVVNSAQSALYRLRSDPSVHHDVLEALELASSQALRAAEMIRNLAGFMKKGSPQRCRCDLNEAIRQVLSFTAAEIRDQGVTIRLDLDVSLPTVLADNIQIQQVILNLVRNGIEAMSEMRNGERIVQIQTSAVEDAVEVAVRDRGPGLTPQAKKRLFTAFFTTKAHGMGVGLSISRSIIAAHGGRLWAEPNPEGGCVFQFRLPLGPGAPDDEHRTDRVRRG